MHSSRTLGVVLVMGIALAAVAAPGAAAGAAPVPDPDSALRLLHTEADGRAEVLTLWSPALGSETRVRVLLPRGYAAGPARHPLLLLLHGGGDDWRAWTDKGGADALTADSGFVVAMPDGGREGWYTDWFGRGRGGPRWETYHVGELLPFLAQRYRLEGSVAVAGLSMGGHGALGYAARHPELFEAVAAFSAVDHLTFASPLSEMAVSAFELGRHGVSPLDVWGDVLAHPHLLRSRNPGDLAPNLASAKLFLYWGDGSPSGPARLDDILNAVPEKFLDQMNQAFVRELHVAGVEPTVVRGPGVHAWRDWQRYLRDALPLLEAAVAPPRPAPSAFDHVTGDAEFSAWDWHVRMERPVPEFAELLDAGAHGFVARATGTMHVRTPARYCPGTRYSVLARRGTSRTAGTVRAGADGRLDIAVDLGPAHTVEDWTLPARLQREALGDGYLSEARVVISGPAVTPDRPNPCARIRHPPVQRPHEGTAPAVTPIDPTREPRRDLNAAPPPPR